MNLKQITDAYAAAPQLEPSDMAQLAQMGVATVICNRPEMENSPPLQAAALQAAAEAAGLAFVFNPVMGAAMTMSNIEEQSEAIAASEGPVVAYCASGMRSAIMWAFANAPEMETDAILEATAQAGFSLDGFRGQIDALAAAK